MQYFIGMLGTVAGFMLVWKTTAVLNFTGSIDFAEKYLGTEGGSRLFIKLVGVLIIFVAWLYMFNMGGWILTTLFLPGRANQS
jgi:predicted small integral membrane protein